MIPAILVAKATFVLTLGLTAAWLTRRRRAAIRHAVLAATFAALLLLPAASLLVPSVNIPVAVTAPAPAAVFTITAAPSAASQPIEPLPTVAPPARTLSLSVILLTIWIAGAALFLLPVLIGLCQVRSLRRSALPWSAGQSLIDGLALEAGLHRRINLLLHPAIPGPMTCGVAHPAIVLPEDARNWRSDDLSRALVHELEHVKRMDWIGHCLARAICAFYWFHPLVWMAWRQLSLAAERSCDDAVLGRSEATAYADQLVALAQRLSSAAKSPLLAMANRADLADRVGAALNPKQKRGPAGLLPVTLASAAAALLVLTLSPLTTVAAPQSEPPAVPTPPVPAAELIVSKPHRAPQPLKMVAVAQSEAPTSPMPNLRATTHLVIEDIAVSDSSGNPIEGLTANDFAVTENGVVQRISVFEFQRLNNATNGAKQYYILGYYSSSPVMDGAFRQIQVTLKGNPAAKLDYRPGYYAGKTFTNASGASAPRSATPPPAVNRPSPPVLTFKKEAEYSEEARKAKYQGSVLLQLNVDTSGEVKDIRVQHAIGLGLDEKAVDAVKQWKFKPAMQDGNPTAMTVQVEVDFRLQ